MIKMKKHWRQNKGNAKVQSFQLECVHKAKAFEGQMKERTKK